MEDEKLDDAILDNINKGYMEIVGKDKDGQARFRITEKGEKFVLSGFKKKKK